MEELSEIISEGVPDDADPEGTVIPFATEGDGAREDFVGEDGLLVCGRCGQPKQKRLEVPFRDKPLVVGVPCECERRAEAEREERERRAAAAEKAKRARRECFRDCESYQSCTFEADDRLNPKRSDVCLRYAETFDTGDPYGLLLWGDVGTGKSYMAAAIANRIIDRGYTALLTDIGSIVSLMESSFDDRRKNLDRILRYDLLVIDDLGAQRGTEYMMEHVYAVIDGRYRSGRPMVITTNFDAEEIAANRDSERWGRIFDRILECCFPVEFKGKSHRRAKTGDMRKEMRARLGL